jgi:FKBP-type peptidyl-prolyl cis-trans isomerase
MKLLNIVQFVSFVLFLACSSGSQFQTTPSGLEYIFFTENSDGIKPGPEDIMELEMVYKTENDSVVFDSRDIIGSPFRMKQKGIIAGVATIDEGLAMMHTGDSARFIVDAETFFLVTQGREVPPGIKPGSKLIFDVKMKNIFNMETYRAQKQEKFASSAQEEETILKSYLQTSNITAEPTTSGLYFIEEIKGKGKKPQAGMKVVIHYTGTFINGQIFDSSLQRNEAFDFVFGAEDVIPGLEEGVSYMNEGGKAMLVIPSHLAYGDKQVNKIPPYSTLIFYIELLEVK